MRRAPACRRVPERPSRSVHLPDGETVEMEGKAGDAIWAEAGPHQPKNVGASPSS